MLQCRQLVKHYPSGRDVVAVLRGIDLDVEPDGMYAVMGPSGSGKTTLLHCLAGLEGITSGQVRYLGKNLHARSAAELAKMRRSEFGFVFQAYNLLPFLTVFQNVALPFRLAGKRPPNDLIREALATLGLSHRADWLPAQLSGGEQQRVALARIAATSPSIVFADEPTGALDLTSSRAVLRALAELAKSGKRAVLVATHDPLIAVECDRVAFMVDGQLTASLESPTYDRVVKKMIELGRTTSETPCG